MRIKTQKTGVKATAPVATTVRPEYVSSEKQHPRRNPTYSVDAKCHSWHTSAPRWPVNAQGCLTFETTPGRETFPQGCVEIKNMQEEHSYNVYAGRFLLLSRCLWFETLRCSSRTGAIRNMHISI